MLDEVGSVSGRTHWCRLRRCVLRSEPVTAIKMAGLPAFGGNTIARQRIFSRPPPVARLTYLAVRRAACFGLALLALAVSGGCGDDGAAPTSSTPRTSVPPPPPSAPSDLPLGSPCTGVSVWVESTDGSAPLFWFDPTGQVAIGDDRFVGVKLTMEWSAEPVVFDWVGVYRDWFWDWSTQSWQPLELHPGGRPPKTLDVYVRTWTIERTGSRSVRHIMDVAWPESHELRIRFRSDYGTCDDEPMVVCSLAGGCAIKRYGSAR